MVLSRLFCRLVVFAQGASRRVMTKFAKGKGSRTRRSSRILLRLPLLVSASEAGPDPAWEKVETIMLSFHGGMIRTNQRFRIGSTMDIRMQDGGGKSAHARVVWQSAEKTARGIELGFEILDEEGFWGVNFPPAEPGGSGDSNH